MTKIVPEIDTPTEFRPRQPMKFMELETNFSLRLY